MKGQCPRPLDDGRMRERARIIPIQKALSSIGRELAVLNLHGCGHLGFADTMPSLCIALVSTLLKLTFSGSLWQKQACAVSFGGNGKLVGLAV